MRGADLTRSNLGGADLKRADLSAAVMTSVVAEGANFERAILVGAVLSGADLTRADLDRAAPSPWPSVRLAPITRPSASYLRMVVVTPWAVAGAAVRTIAVRAAATVNKNIFVKSISRTVIARSAH
jgi:hypothetical protein